jgi:hypothetical protein
MRMIVSDELGRRWPCHSLRHYSFLFMEKLKKIANTLSQDSGPFGPKIESGPAIYKAGVTTT